MQVGCSEFLPLQFLKRWLTFQVPGDELSCDENSDAKLDDESQEIGDDNGPTEILESCQVQNTGGCTSVLEQQSDELINMAESPMKNSSSSMQSEACHQQSVSDREYRIAVGSWNVAGMLPPDDIDLREWLDTSEAADIYVIGFQEIVPLIACNVICMEDEAPIPIWEGLIHHTLNNKMQVFNADNPLLSYREPPIPSQCDVCSHHVPEVSGTNSLLKTVRNEEDELSALLPPEHHLSNSTILHHEQAQINCLTAKQNMSGLENETSHVHPREDSTLIEWSAGATMEDDKEFTSFAPSVSSPCRHNQFLRIVSKKMVGIFITIWIRSDLWHHVHDIKVCSVGCGIFNYLGNKGAVSVSLFLHQTSFCFVCTHLKSGHEEGDELRRNADVAEILRRTTFPRLMKHPRIELPKTIITHE